MISAVKIRMAFQAVCCSCICCICIGCAALPPEPEGQEGLRKQSEEQILSADEEKQSDSSLWPLIIDVCIGISRIFL